MRVGLISDTHGLLRPSVLAALTGVALIVHAGDVGGVNILPRLREILADAGVTLGQAQVGSESAQSSSFGGEKGDNSRSPAGGEGPSAPPGAVVRGGDAIWMQRGRGLVDTFA